MHSRQRTVKPDLAWTYPARQKIATSRPKRDLCSLPTYAASRGSPAPTPSSGASRLRFCLSRKAPKLCPSPATLSSFGRVHSFLRRAFQMVPGGSGAKLHSLSKCCRSPVLPGRGKGDPWLLSSCCEAHFLGRRESPYHLPHTLLPCWRASFLSAPLLLPQRVGPVCKSGGRSLSDADRGRGGGAEGERNAERQQAGPRGTDGKGPSPVITNLGCLHKSNLLISAGVSPPLPPTLPNSSAVKGVNCSLLL